MAIFLEERLLLGVSSARAEVIVVRETMKSS